MTLVLSHFAVFVVAVWCGWFLARQEWMFTKRCLLDAIDWWQMRAVAQKRRGDYWYDEYRRIGSEYSEDWER